MSRASTIHHLPEYAMEGAELGVFMLSACTFDVLIEYPGSPVRQTIQDPLVRRALMGIAMGLTAIAIIYSPWGKQSGAHLNPSVTLTFWRLGKIRGRDAIAYVLAQLVGGALGVSVASLLLGGWLAHPDVMFAVTVPPPGKVWTALLAELCISFIMMNVVLATSSSRYQRWTGMAAGLLVATYITFEAPFSGMSMNPARSLGSAVHAGVWRSLWIYFVAPPLGMLMAAHVWGARRATGCAKLVHQTDVRCIHCGFEPLGQSAIAQAHSCAS